MKFKEYSDGFFQVGITVFFVQRIDNNYWVIWVKDGDSLKRVTGKHRTRKDAGEYAVGRAIRPSVTCETRPLPERPKRAKPEHLTNFMHELKRL